MAKSSASQTYYEKNRKRILAEQRRRYQTDASLREYRKRYREDPVNRARVIARSKRHSLARKLGIVLVAEKRGRPTSDPVRAKVMLKLRRAVAPLTPTELRWVLPNKREEAAKLKRRTLQAIGDLFGVTGERVRQIIS